MEASYTFKIPSNMISSNQIYKIALYPNNPVDPDNQRCAYIGKVDAAGWAPLEIDNTNGNYALEIK